MAGNSVRIIGGKWRGRKLLFPDQADLRPTLGRVRETVFNWLRDDVADSRCLDLFAGSGALGFEALSRGAAAVTFVDSRRPVVKQLQENAARLGAQGVTVICAPAERVLRRATTTWDIIFVDPPFDTDPLPAVLAQIAAGGLLADGGLVYFEAPRRRPLETGAWRQIKHGHAGETQFGLLASP
jgi:16S rRNA (guanine966-N2)-methyltransferase